MGYRADSECLAILQQLSAGANPHSFPILCLKPTAKTFLRGLCADGLQLGTCVVVTADDSAPLLAPTEFPQPSNEWVLKATTWKARPGTPGLDERGLSCPRAKDDEVSLRGKAHRLTGNDTIHLYQLKLIVGVAVRGTKRKASTAPGCGEEVQVAEPSANELLSLANIASAGRPAYVPTPVAEDVDDFSLDWLDDDSLQLMFDGWDAGILDSEPGDISGAHDLGYLPGATLLGISPQV